LEPFWVNLSATDNYLLRCKPVIDSIGVQPSLKVAALRQLSSTRATDRIGPLRYLATCGTRKNENDSAMKIDLRGLPGPFFGKTIEVAVGTLTIGREQDCQLRIESGFVSRHHCLLRVDETGAYVRDLGSKNGTFINSSRVTTRETVLRHGDLLTVGEVAFHVDFGPGAVPQPERDVPRSDVSFAATQQTGQFNDDTVQAYREIPAAPGSPPSPASSFASTLFRISEDVPVTPPAAADPSRPAP
jgi:FHA domain